MLMAFLLASSVPPFLLESATLVCAGALIAYVCHRMGLVPIVGFLIAGVVIGPMGLALVRDEALINAAAEIGVILLLFTIGIEFSLERLARIKKLIFVGGGLQVTLATALTTALLAAAGVDWRTGLFTGFLVSLSSTAIVLKLLADRGETNAAQGQVALGLLIFQDLAIIVMVLLVPVLGGQAASPWSVVIALGKAVGIITLVLVVARRLMPPVLERVARTCSPELFLLTVIAICMGTALLTSLAGVSVSLGAFLAGLMVSESRFSHHAFGEILPLQILFSATFFVSVGLLLDLRFLIGNLPLVLGGLAVVLLIKVLTTGGSVMVLGYRLPVATMAGLMLAQVGEFSFVLERAGRDAGLTPAGLGQAGSQSFIAGTVILMVMTPLLMKLGGRAGSGLEAHMDQRSAERTPIPETPMTETHPHLDHHVILAGYGTAARRLEAVLRDAQIPFLVATLSPGGAEDAEAGGTPVLRGDYSKLHILQLAGLERAKMLVIADDDPATTRRTTAVARNVNPTLRIVARTRFPADADSLVEAGADLVVCDERESTAQIAAELLRQYRAGDEEIATRYQAVRFGIDLRLPQTAPSPGGLDYECISSRVVVVRDGAQVIGRRFDSLHLEERGFAVREVIRRGATLTGPLGGSLVEGGDEWLLSGSAEAFASLAPLLRGKIVDEEVPQEMRRVSFDPNAPVEFHTLGRGCSHLSTIRKVVPSAPGCEECLDSGGEWVHLRICMICGHVGCCDSSMGHHATRHYEATGHPIVRSMEPNERWGWCFPDQQLL